jgi:hypothetical protein
MRSVGQAPDEASALDAFGELERFLAEAGEARLSLSGLERGAEPRGRELLRLALQAHIDERGEGDVGEAIIVQGADGPVRLAYKRRHTRPVLTLFGEVRVTRIGYGSPGHETLHPLDQELMLPGRIYSYECQRRLTRAVVCQPFDEAIAFVAETTSIKVPKLSAEQLVREAAVDFEPFYAQRPAACVKPAKGEILVAAIDCKGIPMVKPERALRVVRRTKGQKANKKRMATVATVHSQAPQLRTSQEVLDSLFQSGSDRNAGRAPSPATSGCGPASPRRRTRSSPTWMPR